MRRLSMILVGLLLVAFVCIAVGCSAGGSPIGLSEGGVYRDGSGKSVSLDSSDGGVGSDTQGGSSNTYVPGQLTAAEWCDNENYDFWYSLIRNAEQDNDGLFVDSVQGYREYGYALNMLKVNAVDGENPVRNALVELYDSDDNRLYTARTDVFGAAYMFADRKEGDYTVRVTSNGATESVIYTHSNEKPFDEITVEIAQGTVSDILEIMFVVDTTGSMGDELDYLKAEIDDVISRVSEMNPEIEIRLGLLFYRDEGDEYVTRHFEFTTDIDKQKKNLAKQSYDGGGDWEEAVDIALYESVNAQWSEHSTKLLIHVLDAPPHMDNQTVKSRFDTALSIASKKGIRIIPVTASGIDKRCEFLYRTEAMLTGGTYVFLTNDSGIGFEKIEATVGEHVVEYLNDCLVRIIHRYISGERLDPVPYKQSQEQ